MMAALFVTLPQVYTEDITMPGVQHSNLGMYRIQLTGNDYILNKEAGTALPDPSWLSEFIKPKQMKQGCL
jgi:hypothetical protein